MMTSLLLYWSSKQQITVVIWCSKLETTFKFMCHIHSPALINTHMGVARLSTLGRQEKNISSIFPHPVIRGVRVSSFQLISLFLNIFLCQNFSFFVSFQPIFGSFTQFHTVFRRFFEPLTPPRYILSHFSSFFFIFFLQLDPPGAPTQEGPGTVCHWTHTSNVRYTKTWYCKTI